MTMSRKEFYERIEELIRKEIKGDGFKNSTVKLEDYDFAELVSDLTNSITDQLYREFFPPAKNLYDEQIKEGEDTNFKNDLDVSDVVAELKSDLITHIRERVAISLRTRMRNELEEQYHPKEGSAEHRVDSRLKSIRKIAIWGYYAIGLIMAAIVMLIGTETIAIGLKTVWLFYESAINVWDGNVVDAVDRSLLNKIIFSILSVLDLLLLASLVVMVLIGGYENTVSRIGTSHDVPTWFGSLGITDLKIKVAASIVIISSIHLLTQFMLIEPTMPGSITPNVQKIIACNSETRALSEEYRADAVYSDKTASQIARIDRAYQTCRLANIETEKLEALRAAGINSADDYFERSYSQTALMWTSIVHAVFVLAALALAYMGKLSSHGQRQSDQNAVDAVVGKREKKGDEDDPK